MTLCRSSRRLHPIIEPKGGFAASVIARLKWLFTRPLSLRYTCATILKDYSDDDLQIVVPPWFLVIVVDPHTTPEGSKRRAEEHERWRRLSIRGYDILSELANEKVVIGGPHHEKGLRGRVRKHLGKKIIRIDLESGSRFVDVHVNYLYST
jgi:hypothetical protein